MWLCPWASSPSHSRGPAGGLRRRGSRQARRSPRLAVSENDFLQGLQNETVRLPNAIFQMILEKRQEEDLDQLFQSLQRFGHQRETVALMLDNEVASATGPIVDYVNLLIELVVRDALLQGLAKLEEELRIASDPKALRGHLEAAKQLRPQLAKRFLDDRLAPPPGMYVGAGAFRPHKQFNRSCPRRVLELFDQGWPKFEEALERVLQRPGEILRGCVEAHCMQCLQQTSRSPFPFWPCLLPSHFAHSAHSACKPLPLAIALCARLTFESWWSCIRQDGVPMEAALKACVRNPLFAAEVRMANVLPQGLVALGSSSEVEFARTMAAAGRQQEAGAHFHMDVQMR